MALSVVSLTKEPSMTAPESIGSMKRRLVRIAFGSSTGGADSGALIVAGTTEGFLERTVGFQTIVRAEVVGAPRRTDLTPATPLDTDMWIDYRPQASPPATGADPAPFIYIGNTTIAVIYDVLVMVYGF